MSEIDIATLYEKKTDEKLVSDANRMATVPTGAYTLQVSSVTAQVGENEKFPPLYQREHAHVRANLEKDGQRMGAVWFDLCWEDVRRADGTLESPSKLWGQAVKAFGNPAASVGEVLESLKQYPVTAFVTEGFKLDGEWKSARNDKERSDLIVAGAEPRNYVQSLSRIK
jgi:hypothetical protein